MPDSFRKPLELRQEALEKYEEAKGLLTRAEEEKRALSSEEDAKFAALHKDGDALIARAEQIEAQRDRELRVADLIDASSEAPDDVEISDAEGRADGTTQERTERAFQSFIRYGRENLTAEELRVMGGLARRARQAGAGPETRAQTVGTNSEGGYLVPEGFYGEIVETLLSFGGMMQFARVIETESGNDLPIPTNNDTANKGALIAEATAAGEQDLVLGQVVLEAFKYTTKMVKVTAEFLQDEAVGAVPYLQRMLATRWWRILNEHATDGDGSSKPRGVVTAASVGKTTAANTAITRDEMLDMKHSVDPSYRGLGSQWMFNDSTLLSLKKLADSAGQPLWTPSFAAGEPPRFDGDTYVINQDMDSIGASANPVVYGWGQGFWIRMVRAIAIRRLNERYAESDEVAFLGFARFDCDLVDSSAIKKMAMPA